MKINPVVFFVAAGVIILFVVLAAVFAQSMETVFDAVQSFIVTRFGWFYIVVVTFFLVFVLWLLISPYGGIRLGKDDEEPEYSTLSWFAMLFSAGMGIGLLFYSVAEPILHFTDPPRAAAGTVEAAEQAMQITFFHWGLHAWAVYIVVGLSLAYFSYRHDLPLTIRSGFYPLIGERIHGWMGNVVTIMAIFGTLFGVATSLGLGVLQVNAGMAHLGLFSVSITNQLILIAVITLFATASVVSGLDVGIRRLSEINLGLGMILVLFVFIAGPTLFLLNTFVQSTGEYLQNLIRMTLRTDAFIGPAWQQDWTLFYWGWWISWSPFVGMFIARVSRGRTIRQFILGALFAPTCLAFIWMVVFGNTAISGELSLPPAMRPGAVVQAVQENLPTGLFVMLEGLPWSTIMVVLATIVIATYFITSSDSASLVIDILSADGDIDPPVGQRIFWALTEGLVAAVLLLTGGLQALQTASITTALPFAVVMLFMCAGLVRGLRNERRAAGRRRPAVRGAEAEAAPPFTHPQPLREHPEPLHVEKRDWKDALSFIVSRRHMKDQAEAGLHRAQSVLHRFIDETVEPAFSELAEELKNYGREGEIEKHDYNATLTVMHEGEEEFSYTVRGRAYRRMTSAFPEIERREAPIGYRAEVMLRGGAVREYDIRRLTKESLIRDFLAEYGKWLGW